MWQMHNCNDKCIIESVDFFSTLDIIIRLFITFFFNIFFKYARKSQQTAVAGEAVWQNM